MRAKVASRAGGHSLEDRFLQLSEIQLLLLYRQAIKEEAEERTHQTELIKTVNSAWLHNFKHFFKELQFFSNPEMFMKKMELESIDELRDELTPDNFEEVWDDLLQMIPNQIVAEEVVDESMIPVMDDPELDALITGWVSRSKNNLKEGE